MIAKLELELSCKEELVYQMSSLFHGALMELLPEEYAYELHASKLHPYTQHLECRENTWYWIITALNRKAVETILKEALWNIEQLELKKKQLVVKIVGKNYREMQYSKLIERFYHEEHGNYLSIHFVSPTAFKQRGKYIFYPDIRCFFQSLMNKYDAASGENVMFDEDALEQICENAEIVRYDLKSVKFSLEGIRIPAFIGKVTIKITGTKTMADFANMLVEFGTYSGVGIKTALGMGSIRKLEERK